MTKREKNKGGMNSFARHIQYSVVIFSSEILENIFSFFFFLLKKKLTLKVFFFKSVFDFECLYNMKLLYQWFFCTTVTPVCSSVV